MAARRFLTGARRAGAGGARSAVITVCGGLLGRARALAAGVAAAVGAVCALGLVVGGCLDDLPEALVCPPEPVYPGDSCAPALTGAAPGCFTPEQMACLSGPRTSCTCIADECPAPEEACYPEGDCPVEVRSAAEGAACVRLAPRDFGGGLPSESMCLCGCAGCMAVCDGKGPVLGVQNDGNVMFAPVGIDIASSMPDAGSLGVFLRERGVAGSLLVVMKGAAPDYEIATYYFITSPVGTDFTSQVFYDDPFLGTSRYTWTRREDRPTLLAIFASEGGGNLMEVDCVIPFVVGGQ